MMNLSTWTLMAAGLVFGSGQPQEAQKPATPTNLRKKAAKRGSSASQSQAAENDAEYKIGPQDVLRVDVWKEADISRAVPVRPDGKIFPAATERRAGRRTDGDAACGGDQRWSQEVLKQPAGDCERLGDQ